MAKGKRQIYALLKARERLARIDEERRVLEKSLAGNFHNFRLAEGIALKDAAQRLSISPQYLNDIEKGRRGLSPEMVKRFEKFFAELDEPVLE